MNKIITLSAFIVGVILLIYFLLTIKPIEQNKLKSVDFDLVTFKYDSLAHSMMLPCEHCETANVILVGGKVSQVVILAGEQPPS